MSTQVSLIIHGPISTYTLLTFYRYREEHPLVFVLPNPTEEQVPQKKLLRELQELSKESNCQSTVVVYDTSVPEGTDNTQNRYYHFFSVAAALELCRTPYAVKIRSDEFYSNLSPFFEQMQLNSDKITTNDVFFRNGKKWKFHPSDHLVGGKTVMLGKIFRLARTYCTQPQTFNAIAFIDTPADAKMKYAAEQLLGSAVLHTLHDVTPDSNIATLMKKSFSIVKTDTLGFFRIACNSLKTTEFFTTEFFSDVDDINDINDYI